MVAEDRLGQTPHQNFMGGTMVAEDRSGHCSRPEIIDLGSWQIALIRALAAYTGGDIEESSDRSPDSAS